jgi:HEAT repeat protein
MGTNAWPAVPALLDLAARDDPTTRFDAMEVLTGIRADQHPAFRVMIADHLKVARCAEDLARTLKSAPSDFWVSTERAKQQFALALLSAAGPAARHAVPSLEVLAESKNDHDLRAAGVAVLRDIGPSARSAVPVLKKLLQDKDEWPDVRSRAASALPRICPKDPEIVRLLSQMLHDDRILVRVRVAGALADLKAPPNDLLPALTNALDHKLASIRLAALESLCEMDDAALPVKEQVASRLQDNDESVRRAALATLQTLARSSTR